VEDREGVRGATSRPRLCGDEREERCWLVAAYKSDGCSVCLPSLERERGRAQESAPSIVCFRASSFSRAFVVTVAVSNHRLPFDLVGAQPIVDST